MVFGFDKHTQGPFKIVPNLTIEEEIINLILGKFCLRAVVYHIGDSTFQGHYVCAVKENGTWYTCNDDKIALGVKLSCDSTVTCDH